MKIFDVPVQDLVAIFKNFLLFIHLLVKNTEFHRPLTQFVIVLADHVAKNAKDNGSASPHIHIAGNMFTIFDNIEKNLLEKTMLYIKKTYDSDQGPTDRSKNAKEKSTG